MNRISHRLEYFDSSDFRNAMLRHRATPSAVDFSIGVPEELTAEHIKQAGINAINADKTTYEPAAGIPQLRKAVANKLTSRNGIVCSMNDIAIVPGLTTGLLLVYLAMLDPGDEIIIFDPYYPPYPHLASMIGAHVVMVQTKENFQPDLDALENSITDRTKLIVVNSPNNPSGAVYPESTLRKIVELAKRQNVTIISDEIYENFIYGDTKHFSIGSIYDNTITMNGFSKEYAMTGWRMGYIAGPSDIIAAINELQQYTVMSSSSIAQYAALAALRYKPRNILKYERKHDYAKKRFNAMGMKVHGGDGAYYMFIKTPNGMTDLEYVDAAYQQGVILIPGRAFSKQNGYVRLSYGTSFSELKRGLTLLAVIT
jgi:aspartate aminotransferase